MPKIRKETVDKIRRLGAEGYTNTEIGEKLGVSRGTARKYRVDAESSLVQEDSKRAGLSLDDGITKVLYDLQGVMGASSIVDAVKRAYQDAVSTAKFKVTHWPTYKSEDEEFTAEAMVGSLLGYIDYLEVEQRDSLNAFREAVVENERLKEFAEERFEEGLEEGRGDHAIYVKCVHCGRPYQVKPLSETHGIITETLMELGWGHTSCANRVEYNRGAGSRMLEATMRGS